MTDLATVLQQAGLISSDVVNEFRQWRRDPTEVSDTPEELTPIVATPELTQFLRQLEEVLQSEGYVITRETDLDVLRHFVHKQEKADLYLSDKGVLQQVEKTPYCRNGASYVFACDPKDDGEFLYYMTNGESYLAVMKDEKIEKVFFGDGTYLYLGKEKAFLSLQPSTKEKV